MHPTTTTAEKREGETLVTFMQFSPRCLVFMPLGRDGACKLDVA
jgi:hypothetical protein